MGEWRESKVGYLERYDVVCALCGQLVPGRFWQETIDGDELRFCSAGHAEKYRTYWLPRYGGGRRRDEHRAGLNY
jgi:hypothetical protein